MILPPVQQLIAYRQKTTNNKCSDVRCDDVWLTRTDLFGVESARESFSGTTVDDPLDEWKTCMGAPITNNEWTKLTTSVFTASSDILHVYTCARSCKYDLALKEHIPSQIHLRRRGAFDQQVTARSTDLVSSFSSRRRRPRSRSKARSCVPGLQLPPPTDRVKKELHFDVSCDSTAPDFATFCTSQLQVKMSDLFALEATLNPNPAVTALLTGRTTSAASIVFWRVRMSFDGELS
ncbi:hypothetical protein H310_11890 [Aphanomyces invadans]|uniref:Uncharacterized protein n=1 Tax=Aphanomyces invadans TaxID=157072 RepID=A0A024TKE9_9STRA|nr:hypothetical protein H310_11890 [Aphanomyces invadans]ETV94630.1 hypothetical protein H310_11890 [Aphanomyces invadans]|eukprot:XP_008876945.1 hypothetical protein H310_11890 [Aphanomyces invadans]